MSDHVCGLLEFERDRTASRLAAAERERDEAVARAERAEAESSEVLSALEAVRAHFLAQIAAGKVGPMPICGWCGEPQKDVESFRSHAVECAKNPSVARAASAEARLREVEAELAHRDASRPREPAPKVLGCPVCHYAAELCVHLGKRVERAFAVSARGTFPGDLDRMPSGHTRHCEARMKWGDGECECGARALADAGKGEANG